MVGIRWGVGVGGGVPFLPIIIRLLSLASWRAAASMACAYLELLSMPFTFKSHRGRTTTGPVETDTPRRLYTELGGLASGLFYTSLSHPPDFGGIPHLTTSLSKHGACPRALET